MCGNFLHGPISVRMKFKFLKKIFLLRFKFHMSYLPVYLFTLPVYLFK